MLYSTHKPSTTGHVVTSPAEDEAEVSLCTQKVGHDSRSSAGASTYGRSSAPWPALPCCPSRGCEHITVRPPGPHSRAFAGYRRGRSGCGAGGRTPSRGLGRLRVSAAQDWLSAAGKSCGAPPGAVVLWPRVSGIVA